jgi:hypothetical protein
MPKQKWKEGDVFLVPQRDGVCTVGQVLDVMMKNVASVALYDVRIPCGDGAGRFDLKEESLIASLSVTRHLLDEGKWRVVGHQPISLDRAVWPNENTRDRLWVGSVTYDAEIAEELLDAYNGLAAWDDWADPTFLDTLLAALDRKPKHVYYKKKGGA